MTALAMNGRTPAVAAVTGALRLLEVLRDICLYISVPVEADVERSSSVGVIRRSGPQKSSVGVVNEPDKLTHSSVECSRPQRAEALGHDQIEGYLDVYNMNPIRRVRDFFVEWTYAIGLLWGGRKRS